MQMSDVTKPMLKYLLFFFNLLFLVSFVFKKFSPQIYQTSFQLFDFIHEFNFVGLFHKTLRIAKPPQMCPQRFGKCFSIRGKLISFQT